MAALRGFKRAALLFKPSLELGARHVSMIHQCGPQRNRSVARLKHDRKPASRALLLLKLMYIARHVPRSEE
jgi:hypothetical protein